MNVLTTWRSICRAALVALAMVIAPAAVRAANAVEVEAGWPERVAADDWGTRAPEFSDTADIGSTPVLLYFTATWCGFCRQMERTTLADAGVRALWVDIPRIKLDLDRERALAGRFEVRGVPAFFLVNERGEVLSRIEGATEAEVFKRWLSEGRARAMEAVKVAARLQVELAALEEEARGVAAKRGKDVWVRLFVLAGGRGPGAGRGFAAELLAESAKKEPMLLVEGLEHADLAVRIVAAKLVQVRVSAAAHSALEFDPWEERSVRQRQVEALRAVLGKL